MGQQKKTLVQVCVIAVLLILTLPFIYMLVSRVLLPMEWNEPQFKESRIEGQ